MNFHENSPMGRRVFFVNPPFYVTNVIIPRLTAMEFEVYSLDNFRLVKPVLRKYPDSICFINIDDSSLDFDGWFRFVESFEKDEVLSTIFFGVISQYAPKPTRMDFMLNVQLPAGFIQYTPDHDALVEIFTAILEMNGALGKRKYIRADCGRDPQIYAEVDLRVQKLPLMIQNISSVGIACYLGPNQLNLLEEKAVYRVTLNLKEQAYPGSVVVLMKREIQGTNVAIMLFGQGLALSSKNMIREFIRKRIQFNLDEEFMGIPLDEEDYSKAAKKDDLSLDGELGELLDSFED